MFKSFFDPRSVAFLGIDVFGGIAIWYAQLKAPAPHCKICTSKWRLWFLCHIYVIFMYIMFMPCWCHVYAMFLMFVAFQGAGSIPVVSLLALAPAPGLQRSIEIPPSVAVSHRPGSAVAALRPGPCGFSRLAHLHRKEGFCCHDCHLPVIFLSCLSCLSCPKLCQTVPFCKNDTDIEVLLKCMPDMEICQVNLSITPCVVRMHIELLSMS